MSGRIEAIVNPGMLRWARDSAGFDLETAAKKIQVKAERLESWEAGNSRPTVKQLRNLGRVYKRPIAVFYLPEPPQDFQILRDFRRLPGQVAGQASPELRFEMRRAQNRRELAVELFELTGDDLPTLPLHTSLTDDPEHVGEVIRDFLGVTYDAQMGWKSAPNYESFNNWRAVLENAGILVFQVTEVDVQEARGFSLTELPLPAIVINNKDSLSGRTFTMLHELAHILLRQGGVCDLYEDVPRPPEEQAVEVFCNRVAAAALLPREDLLNEAIVSTKAGMVNWTDTEILHLANRYGSSREALLRRLLTIGRTTEAFYQAKRKQYQEEYQAIKRERGGGFAPPHSKAISSSGHMFVRLVLNNYRQDTITAGDVADFLDIRLKHLNKIEAAVLKPAQ